MRFAKFGSLRSLKSFCQVFCVVAGGAILAGCTLGLPPLNVGANTFPTANAGPDKNVGVGMRVILDALSSTDNDGDPLSYS
ncbi:MAG: hypothetical protein ACE5IL_16140, partial [Myxococcota bacterium]